MCGFQVGSLWARRSGAGLGLVTAGRRACRRGGFFSRAMALCGDSRAEGLWPPKGTTAAEHSEPPQHAAAAGGGLQGLALEARRREPKEKNVKSL